MALRGVGSGGPAAPGVGRRIVDVVLRGRLVGRRQPSADGMDLSVDRDHREMVARERQRRRLAPFAGRGIVDLVRRQQLVVAHAPADDMDLAVDRATPTAERGRLHGREPSPCVARRIVFQRDVGGALMHRRR